MPVCVPIRSMKDTARFSQLVEESSGPVTVTKNGYDSFVVMRSEDYEVLLEQVAKAELLSRLALAEDEIAAEKYVDAATAVSDIRRKYDL